MRKVCTVAQPPPHNHTVLTHTLPHVCNSPKHVDKPQASNHPTTHRTQTLLFLHTPKPQPADKATAPKVSQPHSPPAHCSSPHCTAACRACELHQRQRVRCAPPHFRCTRLCCSRCARLPRWCQSPGTGRQQTYASRQITLHAYLAVWVLSALVDMLPHALSRATMIAGSALLLCRLMQGYG